MTTAPQSGGRSSLAMIFLAIAVITGIVQLAFVPFVLGPVAIIALVASVIASTQVHKLTLTAAWLITVFFVVGAAITVWYSRPLY